MRWYEFKGADPEGFEHMAFILRGERTVYQPAMLYNERITLEMADPNGIIGCLGVLRKILDKDYLIDLGFTCSDDAKAPMVRRVQLPKLTELANKNLASLIVMFDRDAMEPPKPRPPRKLVDSGFVNVSISEYRLFFVDCQNDRWTPLVPQIEDAPKDATHRYASNQKTGYVYDYLGVYRLNFSSECLRPYEGRRPYTLGKKVRRLARENLWDYARDCL